MTRDWAVEFNPGSPWNSIQQSDVFFPIEEFTNVTKTFPPIIVCDNCGVLILKSKINNHNEYHKTINLLLDSIQ